MEQFDQAYGYILYRHQLPAAISGDLTLDELHDYAQIYLDGKFVGKLDRRDKQSTLAITTTGPARLDILVENSARINFSPAMRGESKGITKSVTLAGAPLTKWQIYSLPMAPPPAHLDNGPLTATASQAVRPGPIHLAQPQSTLLRRRHTRRPTHQPSIAAISPSPRSATPSSTSAVSAKAPFGSTVTPSAVSGTSAPSKPSTSPAPGCAKAKRNRSLRSRSNNPQAHFSRTRHPHPRRPRY